MTPENLVAPQMWGFPALFWSLPSQSDKLNRIFTKTLIYKEFSMLADEFLLQEKAFHLPALQGSSDPTVPTVAV
jgi:hypothetical protein